MTWLLVKLSRGISPWEGTTCHLAFPILWDSWRFSEAILKICCRLRSCLVYHNGMNKYCNLKRIIWTKYTWLGPIYLSWTDILVMDQYTWHGPIYMGSDENKFVELSIVGRGQYTWHGPIYLSWTNILGMDRYTWHGLIYMGRDKNKLVELCILGRPG